MTGSCLSAGCPGCRQPKSPAAAEGARLLSHVEGQALHGIASLKADAERVAKVMGQIGHLDHNEVERAMIAVRRATAQLERLVARTEVK